MSRGAIFVVCGFILSGCASVQLANQPPITMGDAVCEREATQIYFADQDDTLSIMAAQVVSRLSNKLARCTSRKVILVAVSGNDGAAATAIVATNRTKVVRDILISQGLNPSRIIATTDGSLVNAIPRGPIGGVVVMTRQ